MFKKNPWDRYLTRAVSIYRNVILIEIPLNVFKYPTNIPPITDFGGKLVRTFDYSAESVLWLKIATDSIFSISWTLLSGKINF